jgi:hypothetical protein
MDDVYNKLITPAAQQLTRGAGQSNYPFSFFFSSLFQQVSLYTVAVEL